MVFTGYGMVLMTASERIFATTLRNRKMGKSFAMSLVHAADKRFDLFLSMNTYAAHA